MITQLSGAAPDVRGRTFFSLAATDTFVGDVRMLCLPWIRHQMGMSVHAVALPCPAGLSAPPPSRVQVPAIRDPELAAHVKAECVPVGIGVTSRNGMVPT